MAGSHVLVDAGPLIALLNTEDLAHTSCTQAARKLPLPLITTWLVIAEAAWLLRRVPDGELNLLRLLSNGIVQCTDLGADAPRWMAETFAKYSSLHPQLADLSLLYLAERESISVVFTLDRRDFAVYRTKSGAPFSLLPE